MSTTQLESSCTKFIEMAKAKQLDHQTKKQFGEIYDLLIADFVEAPKMEKSIEIIGNVLHKCINQDSRYNIQITQNPNFIVTNLERVKEHWPDLNVMDMKSWKQHQYRN